LSPHFPKSRPTRIQDPKVTRPPATGHRPIVVGRSPAAMCTTVGRMINIASDFDDAFKKFEQNALDQMHEAMAQGLAEQMRELDRDNADAVDLKLESDTDDPRFQIDGERVRRRANEILAG
jgi:hypothetical protein